MNGKANKQVASRLIATSAALFALFLCGGAALAQPLPVLQYEPPKNFTGSLGKDPSAHVSFNADAMINVYPFRRVNGPFESQFRNTRLSEQLTPDSREGQLAGPVEFQSVKVPGAEVAMFARFVEDRSGAARYRLRVAVYSGGAVALVDYNAAGPDGYQRNWPAIAGVLDSLRVATATSEARTSPPPKPGSTGGVDGLYLANTRRFYPAIGGVPGSGDWRIATRFYLLSPDGRVHRGYDLPAAPGGNIRAFDYATAAREDAANTGTFSVEAARLTLRTGAGETVEGVVDGDGLAIDNMKFKKAALK
jgi:hypothetical protein